MFIAELIDFDFFFLITVLCHVLSCLCVSVGHNSTQDVTMATAAALDEPSNMECTVFVSRSVMSLCFSRSQLHTGRDDGDGCSLG